MLVYFVQLRIAKVKFLVQCQRDQHLLFTQKGNALTRRKKKYSSLSYKLSFVDVRNSYEYWQSQGT